MSQDIPPVSRRRLLAGSLTAGAGLMLCGHGSLREAPNQDGGRPAPRDRALVAITLDLEMSRNFPSWDQTHWDYHKGDLDTPTKRYAVEFCRRVRALGGRVHLFAVGRVFEQDSVEWLRGLVRDGHPVGNHTYDHVNVLARSRDELQPRFRRWPWLMQGRTPQRVITDQVRMTDEAITARL